MAPHDVFLHAFSGKIIACALPALVVAGLVGLFRKDLGALLPPKLRSLIQSPAKRPAFLVTQDHLALDGAPSCPDCRRTMIKRIALKGENRGLRFWGCTGYPSCQGARSIIPHA